MSVTKDSPFAAMAGERYKVVFQHAQWAFSVDQYISSLFFLSLYFEYHFHNKQINNSHENSFF